MNRGFVSGFRLGLVCLLVLAAFGGIVARLINLQVVRRAELASQVERTRRRVDVLSAARGEIRDTNGNILATNRSVVEVGVDPQSVRPEDLTHIPQIARLLDVPESRVREAFDRKTVVVDASREVREVSWVKIADGIDEATLDKIKALGVKAIYGNRYYRRVYPMGSLAAHVVGYVNRENTAAMGVERYLDYYLRGEDGWLESERDGRRRELAQFRTREVPAHDGADVVLSIDSVVQDCIERELRDVVRRFNPVGATIIVSDPRTGFVLGMANAPTFDLNAFNKADLASQRNLAITDIFEPGSTFKIVAASAALNEGLVTQESVVDCSLDHVAYGGHELQLPRDDTHHYGRLSVAQVVAKSSNRGAAQLGMLLGSRRLYEYAEAFGFGSLSGFALGGEVRGILHPPERWDGLTITRLPMGHAVGVTPLQVHCAMAAIANDGQLMRPQVVRRVVGKDGRTMFEFEPFVRRQVVQTETARLMARLLTRVVGEGGTAPKAAIDGFEVAGKTGTTQKIVDGRYSNTHHVGSFVGFFPASDPRLVISVIIDDARLNGTAYGSTVAAPSFKIIAEQLIQYLGIPKPGTAPGAASQRLVAAATTSSESRRDRVR